MTALICFFPLLENTLGALAQTDRHQMDLFRALRASRRQTLWRLQVPAGRHVLWAGLRVALVLAWVGAVVSEFIGTTHGLGAVIIGAQGSMDTALLFAALVWVAALGMASYTLLNRLEQRLAPPS
jgi:NitT/TauT family transport system permease protein